MTRFIPSRISFSLFICLIFAAGPLAIAETDYAAAEPPQEDEKTFIRLNLVSTCLASDQCSIFLRVIEASSLQTFLREEGPFTLLAPTDAAFAQMDAATVEALTDPENAAAADTFIRNHLIPEFLPESQLLAEEQPTWNEKSLHFERKDGKLHVNGVAIRKGPVPARNGQVFFLETALAEGK